MNDHATKHYLRPDSHAAKLESAIKSLGRRYALHERSTLAYVKDAPTVLTAWTRKKMLRELAGKK